MTEGIHDLEVSGRRDGDVGTVRLKGEMRAELVHRLTSAAEDLAGEGAKHLVLDLGGVSFVDSASIGAVVRLDADVTGRGGRTVLHSLPRIAKKVLEVTGLAARVTVAKDEAEARKILAAR